MNTVYRTRDSQGPLTRDLILATARQLLAGSAYEDFSMRKLANAVGCSPGALYLHFGNKAELVGRLVDQTFARLESSLRGLKERHREGDPVVLLKKALYTYIEFGRQNPMEYRLAFLALPPTECDSTASVLRLLRSIVNRCVAERAFRAEVEVDCTTQALWAAIHGTTSLLIQGYPFVTADRSRLVEQVISNSVDGLVAEAPAAFAVSA